MKITKLGHCAMIIEEKGLRILTDPGNYSTAQNGVTGVDIILITHEHGDHFHLDSLKAVLKNNPQAVVITNSAVGKLLDAESISYQLVEHGQGKTISEVLFEGFGQAHAPIYKSWGSVENTGYFIANRFFYPGDAFTQPGKAVEILALPVAGPWLKISECIDYALAVNPTVCFPVHDRMLKFGGGNHKVPEIILKEKGIQFSVFEEGKEYSF